MYLRLAFTALCICICAEINIYNQVKQMLNVNKISDICYSSESGNELLLDLYLPAGNGPFPMLVFFYGGGLVEGSKELLSSQAEEFAKCGIAVALPNYRLYPHIKYPVFIDDAAKSVAWLKEHVDRYFSCNGIFIGGHSAGAYIAMMLCFNKTFLSSHDVDSDLLNGYIFCSGQPTTHFNVLAYQGKNPKQIVIYEEAPIYHIRSTGAPLQILCADHDIEGRLEQTQLMASALRLFQYDHEVDLHILQGHDHGSYLNQPEGQHSMLFQLASSFIRRHIHK